MIKNKHLICPGTAKSATTTLFNVLGQHPKISVPYKKEIGFFSLDYEKGYEHYKDCFTCNENGEILLDVSPVYSVDEDCHIKIRDMLGDDVRVIIMLRDPVKRMYSEYMMELNLSHEKSGFEEAVFRSSQERIRLSQKVFGHDYGLNYIQGSMYGELLEKYYEIFSKDKIKVVIFEEFITSIENEIKDICDWAGIDGTFAFDFNKRTNSMMVASRFRFFEKFIYWLKMRKVFRKTFEKYRIKHGDAGKLKVVVKKIKDWIIKLQPAGNEKLDEDSYDKLYNYFIDDIEKLKRITGKTFKEWHY